MPTVTLTGSWWQNHKAQAIKYVVVSVGIILAFSAYLWLIGIPKTQARNLFNQAEQFIEVEDYDSARTLLEQAYAQFPELYISEALSSLPQE